MATTLVSPGVSVSVIDESFYAPSGPGTVPFILLATQESKTNPSGVSADGTLPENAGKVYSIGSRRELLDLFGSPVFPKNASGNSIYGSELAEYGLLAAHSVLDITSRAYVVRADVDLAQLVSTSTRPSGAVPAGTNWLDTSTTNWGIFEWNAQTQAFSKINPRVITSDSDVIGAAPLTSIGQIGDYAVVTTNANNPVYYKNDNNDWVLVGGTDWQNSYPTVISGNYQPVLSTSKSIMVNGVQITLTGTTVSSLATQINNAHITGVTANGSSGYLEIYVTSEATSDGSTVDGKLHLTDVGIGTTLTILGIDSGYYFAPVVTLAPHTQVPAWKSFDAAPRPTGSVWVKTTAVSNGANFSYYRWSANSSKWILQSAPLYSDDATALRYLDPVRGGIGIAKNATYIQYDVEGNHTAEYKIWNRGATGVTKVVGSNTAPSFTYNDSFTVQVSLPGSSTMSGAYTVTLTSGDGSSMTPAIFVSDILSAGIPYIDAAVETNGAVSISHQTGGVIYLKDVTGTPLADAGITTSSDYARAGNVAGRIVVSNWELADYTAESVPPVAAPTDGTMWYYGTPIVADIMINDGTHWRGYRTLQQDARGFDLTQTDPNGPIISASKPTTQSDGITSLVQGDLWLDTSDLENYPKIYRWQEVATEPQWVALDATDDTHENGVVFADARWGLDDSTDPALDDLPAIADLLLSDTVDLDAPSVTTYPRGILLFNTRRSSYNVKEYVVGHFSVAAYGQNLPVKDAWVSISGSRANGVPYFGRRAQRAVVVAAMRSAIDLSEELREDARFFNLICAPGYPELTQNMVALNTARRETAFVIADTPMGLRSDSTAVENYLINASGDSSDGEYGLVTNNSFVAVFYPSCGLTNDTTGTTVAVPSSHMMLRTFINNDNKAFQWFAPAGEQRGTIDNATDIGYVNRATGEFVKVGTRQALRDLLYQNRCNPIAVFSTSGILNYGQKTRASTTTALDRINVARLINYIRFQLEKITKPLIFEPNDKITRNEAKQSVESMLNDVLAKRGLYDYLVVCDESNNTPSRIDRNELYIDVAIEPVKAVEFIYIPVRIKNTGELATGNNVTAQTV